MKKPTIYLDTTVISSYWYEGNDVLALARRLLTRDWWENERQEFKPNDAMQMAVASVHEVCYLLTCNYAHLANPQAQESLERVCRDAGHRAPIMVTPESIPSTRRGQNIRRTRNADR